MTGQEEMLGMIRNRLNLDSKDISRDAEIVVMTPMEKLREVAAWNLGDRGWADQFIAWAKDCGFEVNS